MRHVTRLFGLLVIAACLSPSRVGAVIGTEVIGIGALPEQVTITFPDGTTQTANPNTPDAPILIVTDPARPGAARVVFDFPVTDGTVAITGVNGAPLAELVFEDGRVRLDANDPHALADYLRGLEVQAQTDWTAYERYHEVWNSIPESAHQAIYDVWEAQDGAAAAADDAAPDQTPTALNGQQWAANTADVLVGAYLTDETGVRAQAGERIQRSREHYAEQIGALRTEAQRLGALVADAQRAQDTAQANLTANSSSFIGWVDYRTVARTASLEAQLDDAKTRTLVLKGQLAATVTALQNLSADAQRYEQAISLDATRKDPQLLAQAAQQRFDEAVALSQELAMKKQQFVEGHSAFEGQLNALDNKIAQGRQHGLDDAVAQWEKDKISVQTTYDLWRTGMQVAIESRGWDLHQAFARNQADGIGATDPNVLRAEVVTRGLDVGILEFTADQLITFRGGLAGPATGIAAGAVGLDVQQYDWRDFAYDYSDEFYVTFSSWEKFSGRYGAYWGGVGRATKDAVYDIYVLGKAGIDTAFQSGEFSVNFYTGSNINVFGDQNLRVIYDFANASSKLDSELVYQTTQAAVQWGDRRLGIQSASGEKGLRQGLGDAGYVVGSIAGLEEAAPRLVVAGVRGGAKFVYAGRVINAAEDAASAGADASRALNLGADANRVGDAGGVAADSARAANVVDEGAGIGRIDGTAPPPAGTPLPTTTALIGTRGGEIVITRQGSRITLTHSDGYTLQLDPRPVKNGGHLIGGGSTSAVYVHPNNPGQVIKITAALDNAGIALDNFGYKVLQDADQTKLIVPKVHEQFAITGGEGAGGVVSIVDRAPPTIKDSPQIIVNSQLTPGQVSAYQAAYGEMIARGVVLFDTKADNWALQQVGPGDEWVAVLVDPGSVVPVVGRDPQIAEQLARGLHTLDGKYANWGLEVASHKQRLADNFDDLIDWDALNLGTGGNYRTLGAQAFDDAGNVARGAVPYNPFNVKQFPALQTAFAPGAALPAGVLPAPVANLGGQPFRINPTVLDTSLATLPPNYSDYFRFADTALDTGTSGTLIPNYFRDAPGLLPGSALLGRPGAIVHTAVDVLKGLNVTVDSRLLPFLTRRFVIGLCDSNAPESCGNATGVAVFSFPADQALALGQQLQGVPGITHFEFNPGRFEKSRLNDPLHQGNTEFDQWAIARVGFHNGKDSAWDAAAAKHPVTVAVIDTGVAWGHADLGPEQLWVNRGEIPGNRRDDDTNGYIDDIVGWNFVDNNNLPWDLDGHGTLVAGVIAAKANNGLGIAGINPRAKVMVLRALNHAGDSKASNIAEAITYAANNGAKVINLSVGGQQITKTERLAIAHAHAQGVVVVVAAGNESADVSDYGPAGDAPEAIIVAASDRKDARLAASNWGRLVDVTAPGVDVVGTRAIGTDLMRKFTDIKYAPGGNFVGADRAYYRATGTSFAAAIVAGTASLMLSARPELTPEQVARMIRNSARDIGAPGVDQLTGYGLLDARAALTADPQFFLEGEIKGVRVAQRNGKAYLDVLGSVHSDALESARIEIGAGEAPADWRSVASAAAVKDDVLASIESTSFTGSKVWALRLVARHRNGAQREARFALNVN